LEADNLYHQERDLILHVALARRLTAFRLSRLAPPGTAKNLRRRWRFLVLRTDVMAVRVIRPDEPPNIKVEELFQDIAKTADPAKIAEQLRHANEQLEITRHYPGRTPPQMTGFDCQQS
jgi:hypothetical protein